MKAGCYQLLHFICFSLLNGGKNYLLVEFNKAGFFAAVALVLPTIFIRLKTK